MLTVVKTTLWKACPSTCAGDGGMYGQLTKIEYAGTTAYVREADLRKNVNSFVTSSGERWGMKIGKSKTPSKHQALELCAPPEIWAEIADAVKAADALRRPVIPNRRFTPEWAERQFSKGFL